MGITQDVKKLQEQMKVLMELLRHPSKQASTVLYLVETVQGMENVNFDLSTKWNTAVDYLQNKQLVQEYNDWVEQIDKIPNPQMKQLFMLQPIGQKPVETPSAPALCGVINPFRKDVTCFDQLGHEGEEHLGIDKDGKMFKWTKDKDLGEVDNVQTPEVPEGAQPEIDELPEAPADESQEVEEEEQEEDNLTEKEEEPPEH
jgi:hypothetical protein